MSEVAGVVGIEVETEAEAIAEIEVGGVAEKRVENVIGTEATEIRRRGR